MAVIDFGYLEVMRIIKCRVDMMINVVLLKTLIIRGRLFGVLAWRATAVDCSVYKINVGLILNDLLEITYTYTSGIESYPSKITKIWSTV